METFRGIFESNMSDGFEEAVEKIANKMGFIKTEDNLYFNSNDDEIQIIDDEYERSIIIDMGNISKKSFNKLIKGVLKKYNGSVNKLSDNTEYNFYDKE